ncbi:MAG: alanyl-tRNA editing protein [Acidobacteriota bacterium]|nr:MAG: alanyl-tRNA editing protein [Acidobacteriota bacterium]
MTEKLYYTDPYMQTFFARVLDQRSYRGKTALRLDQTAFYPESGGQPSDVGSLGPFTVVDVQEDSGEILHLIEEDQPEETSEQLEGRIDWVRRFDHMQQHTGQHILSQAFFQVTQAPTESFHMGAASSTIDLAIESLSRDQLYAVEDRANQIIFENRPIRVSFVDSESQSEIPLRKESTRTGTLRIVEIEGFDHSACGGTHCRQTGEVGLIKIRRWERVRQQARVEFFCGRRALLDYRFKNREMYQLAKLFSTAEGEVLSNIEKRLDTERQQRKEIEKLRNELLAGEAVRLARDAESIGSVRLICQEVQGYDVKELNRLASILLGDDSSQIVILGSMAQRAFVLAARSRDLESPDMNQLLKEFGPKLRGGGGGSPERAQLAGAPDADLPAALAEIRSNLLYRLK